MPKLIIVVAFIWMSVLAASRLSIVRAADNARAYEMSGNQVTIRPVVAKFQS
jgi:hypothetical protein